MDHRTEIVTGAFTIQPADADLVEALTAVMDSSSLGLMAGSLAAEPAHHFLDVRRLVVDEAAVRSPALFAIAMDFPSGCAWLVRGELPIALIPVEPTNQNDTDMVRPLVAWAETLSPLAAAGMVSVAYGGRGLEVEQGQIHVLVELPLSGETLSLEESFDSWLDTLTIVCEETLGRNEVDAEVVFYDSSDELSLSISGHVTLYADTEEDAVDLVRDALFRVLVAFIPAGELDNALSVEVEGQCMYDLYADYLSEIGHTGTV